MPSYKKLHILPLIASICCIGLLSSYQLPDEGFLREITAKFTRFNERFQPHKIYLHIDKSYYATGETIWFKAYQVNGSTHEPYSVNKVIYAELIDTAQQVILREKLRVEQGFAYGDFLLSDSLPTGMYTIRAYNNWMRNFDPAFFFHQQVQIFNTLQPGQPVTQTARSDSGRIDLQFFPESGNLVNGLPGKVAFKAVNTEGKGTDVAGIITDETGDTITAFKSLHLGMGAFHLQPEAGKIYMAAIRLTDSTLIKHTLPPALNSGIVMAVDNASPERIQVQVSASTALQKEAMYLIAQVRGQIYFSSQIDLQAVSEINIPKKDFPNGIAQLTLLNSNGDPQCERLVFVNHENDLRIRVNTAKNAYAPREKITMQIEVSDQQGNPVSTHLSLAVTDAALSTADTKYDHNILSYLLLTSDLKGNIEQPAFYFSKNNPEAKQALDHLMLTQGWRRFVWKEILSNNYREIVHETENGITLTGKLVQAAGKNPEPNQFIALSAPGVSSAFQHQYTDEAGNFYFSGLQFTGNKQLFVHVPVVGAQIPGKIEFDTIIPVAKANLTKQIDFQVFSTYLEKSRMAKRIAQVYGGATAEASTAATDSFQLQQDAYPKKTYAIADVPADHSIELDKYNEFPDMNEVFREIVPGILIKNKKGISSLRVLNIKSKLYFKGEPVYFIDGIPVYEASHLFKLDPGMVETIEVYGRPEKLARFDRLGKEGVIAIFTRTGDFYPENTQGSYIVPFTGYYQAREFYIPAYDKDNASLNERKPDFRPVLYWNPKINTDTNGKATLSFYAADDITNYKAMVEGISDKGTPGIAEYEFHVKLPLQSKK